MKKVDFQITPEQAEAMSRGVREAVLALRRMGPAFAKLAGATRAFVWATLPGDDDDKRSQLP